MIPIPTPVIWLLPGAAAASNAAAFVRVTLNTDLNGACAVSMLLNSQAPVFGVGWSGAGSDSDAVPIWGKHQKHTADSGSVGGGQSQVSRGKPALRFWQGVLVSLPNCREISEDAQKPFTHGA